MAAELRDLSEAAILDELTRRCRDALLEERVAERVKRRGWMRLSLEVLIQDHGVRAVNVGVSVHHNLARARGP